MTDEQEWAKEKAALSMNAEMSLRLDAAIQPLLAIEGELRHRGQIEGDQPRIDLAQQVWAVVEELQCIVHDLDP